MCNGCCTEVGEMVCGRYCMQSTSGEINVCSLPNFPVVLIDPVDNSWMETTICGRAGRAGCYVLDFRESEHTYVVSSFPNKVGSGISISVGHVCGGSLSSVTF